MALDMFTCGKTDPRDILAHMCEVLDLGDISVQECVRFVSADEQAAGPLTLESWSTAHA